VVRPRASAASILGGTVKKTVSVDRLFKQKGSVLAASLSEMTERDLKAILSQLDPERVHAAMEFADKVLLERVSGARRALFVDQGHINTTANESYDIKLVTSWYSRGGYSRTHMARLAAKKAFEGSKASQARV
jgi:hypothetical protein